MSPKLVLYKFILGRRKDKKSKVKTTSLVLVQYLLCIYMHLRISREGADFQKNFENFVDLFFLVENR